MNRLIKRRASQENIPIKLVVVGDGTVGKTSLLLAYMKNQYYEDHEPTLFDTMTKEVTIPSLPNVTILLTAEDTAGQEGLEHLRPFSYTDADVILLCFSVENRDSFENIQDIWLTEVSKSSLSSFFF